MGKNALRLRNLTGSRHLGGQLVGQVVEERGRLVAVHPEEEEVQT